MVEFATLNAKPRVAGGKGPANRIRRQGQIPAIAYGRSLENLPIAIDPKALVKILQGPLGLNTVLHLDVEGKTAKDLLVMVREFTHHPVTRQFVHADFIQVKLEEDVEVDVPFITTGKAAGIMTGGVVHQIYRKLPVRTRPNSIPVNITIDITALEMGNAIKVQDLTLPPGVTIRLPQEQSIVAVVAPEREKAEDVVAAVPGAAAPGAAGAAPAAGAAAAGGKAGAAAPAAAAGKDAKAAPAAKKK
ncbi:MAG: 50S ribosomal protein L25 [Polyangiales bacterium]